VSNIFPKCKIDLFVKGKVAVSLFKNYENVENIIQLPKRPFQHLLSYINGWIQIRKNRYDIAVNVDQSSSSGRLSVLFANSRSKILGGVIDELRKKYADYDHHAKFPVYNLWKHLGLIRLYDEENRMPPVDLKLEASEIAEGKKILRDLVRNENLTICLFTFATGQKCYSQQWWVHFYEKLRAEFPHANIIEILPLHKVSGLSSRIASFYSTDIREIGSVIANCALFIGADSGIMHLASSVKTPTVGLFSVTDQTRYAPYQNNSTAFNTNSGDFNKCLKAISFILNRRTGYENMGEEAVVYPVKIFG
jgi:ADP-heptose:LPS heptosyltransferase